jgi:hypothetical protein
MICVFIFTFIFIVFGECNILVDKQQERNLFAGYEIVGQVKALKLDGKYQARWVR